MSLPVPVAVHLGSTRLHQAVTGHVRDFSFRKTVPGGYASATVELDRPLSAFSGDLAEFGTLEISDSRHGGMVWEGRVEDPGGANDATGPRLQINALGPSASFGDVNRPYVGIDSSIDNWIRGLNGNCPEPTAWSTSPDSQFGNNGPSITAAVPQGATVASAPAETGASQYRQIFFTGQAIGSVRSTHREGVTDSNWQITVVVVQDAVTNSTAATHTASTSAQSFDVRHGVAWSLNAVTVYLTFRRLVTGTIGANNFVTHNTIVVKPRLTNRAGTLYTSTNTLTTNATEIIEDLLGGSGRLPLIDAASATIAANVNDIKHLVYIDGVTARELLDDLMLLEPDRYYAAWEKTSNGRHRFEWAAWPTTVRYEASARAGFDSPGSRAELWNEVTVRFRDAGGDVRTVRRTQNVPSLTAAGITRATILDLGDNLATTEAEANAAGDQFLAEHRYPIGGGTIDIDEPIVDRLRGRVVMPHEIEPGYLLAVTDAEPASGNSMIATEQDGRTVWRIVAVDYRASTNTAACSLGEHARTGAQGVADLKGSSSGYKRVRDR